MHVKYMHSLTNLNPKYNSCVPPPTAIQSNMDNAQIKKTTHNKISEINISRLMTLKRHSTYRLGP